MPREVVQSDVLAEAREACYKARDAFYACLEKESGKTPTEIASVGLLYPSDCKASRAQYVNLCRASWVNHFDRQYSRNIRVERLLDDKQTRRETSRETPKDVVDASILSEAREACYKARDAFYACLEKESGKKPTEIASAGLLYPSDCKASRSQYVNQCRAAWVNHYDKLYSRNRKTQRHLDDNETRRGPLVLPQPYTFKPTSTTTTST